MSSRTKRNPLAAVAIASVMATSPISTGAPSTYLETEIALPLESETSFVLIDQQSGQFRLVRVDASNDATPASPQHTGLPAVTGATSGFETGGGEALVFASATANRLALFDLATNASTPLFPDWEGPNFPVYVRKTGIDPQDLHIAHTFTGLGDTLTHYREPAGAFNQQDEILGFDPIGAYQPYFDTPAGARYAAGAVNDGASSRLFFTLVSAGDQIGGSLAAPVPEDTLLATNIRRSDATLMLVGYVVGSPKLSIVPIAAPPSLGAVTTQTVPFPVGSVSPSEGIDGILVTARDGSVAVHYSIDPANNLNQIEAFNPPGGDPIHGLVPVPGRGVTLLTGPEEKPSNRLDFYAWSGGGWELKDSEELPPLVPDLPEFATLFWFSSEPLVDPLAQLLDMEVSPDWTSKSNPNPIPASVLTETYLGPVAGLDNPTPMPPSPPAGATHLVTNQFIDSISLSAMDDKLALTLPVFDVEPASGTYDNPVEATAIYDEDTTEVFYRLDEFGASWEPYVNVIPISYNATYQFYARNLMDGTPGPIISRSYDFATGDLTSFDSDGDGVPDFVEVDAGLDPRGGADTDVDGFTDLDELINGSDPTDPSSTPATATYPFTGEGFRLLAQANNTGAGEASDGDPADPSITTDGEPIDLHSMTSSLLSSAPVEPLTAPASLLGQLAADLAIGTPVPAREWLLLNSPQYFNLDGGAPEVRGGREIYKVIQRPEQTPPTIAPVLTGNDLAADAAVWVTAAAAAYATYEQVSAITELDPIDTALSVVSEAAIYDALAGLDPGDQTALGVPQEIPADPGPPAVDAIPGYVQFTLFGNRDGDADRTPLNDAMRDALIADGLNFEALRNLLETQILSSSPSLNTLTNALYDYHVAHSEPTAPEADVIPLLPLPLDVLRELVRGGDLPTDYVGVVTVATVNVAKTELANALALLSGAYRPVDTWTVEVAAPEIPGEAYSYTNLDTTNPVAFYEADGDSLGLDQGLGLAFGMRFSVTGYTDVTGPAGHDAMELISLNVVFVPSASDTDTDGNLLDDQWEEFFFGDTGVGRPHDPHPLHGFTYLQLFLIGHDPRDDCAEVPDEALLDLAPDNITIVRLPSENLAITFTFPDDYIDFFEWGASSTESLGVFVSFTTSTLTNTGPDAYSLDLGAVAPTPVRNFFHLCMSLK